MDLYLDRSWMTRRKSSAQIGATTEFRAGCQVSLEYAYSHPECVNGQNKIRCPCLKYKNVNYMNRDVVNYHLLVYGFIKNYEECWWAHEQRRDGGITEVHNPDSSTHRMNEMVHDITGPYFDWEQGREQPMNFDAKDFFKLLDEGSEPLWYGCTKHTTLSAVATLLNIKADHNKSHECFESLLKAIKSMLPEGEKLHDNYYYSKKMVKKLGLGYQKIVTCPNDCMLFFKENEQMTRYMFCSHDRFRPNKEGVTTKKSTIPFKILRYFPITHRLKRLYMSSRTAEHMSWNAKSPAKDGELNYPADGQTWKDFNLAHPWFALEPKNVRLGFSTYGFNPFGYSAVPYSCWHVIFTPYNLPP